MERLYLIVVYFLSFIGLVFGAPIHFNSSASSSSSLSTTDVKSKDEMASCLISQDDPEPIYGRASLAYMTLIAMSGNLDLHPHWCPSKLKNVFQYIAYEAATAFSSETKGKIEEWELLSSRQVYASCLSGTSEKDCEEMNDILKEHGGKGCGWCTVMDSDFHEKLGEGTCLPKTLYQRCAIHQRTVYPYLMDFAEISPLPSNAELGACLQQFDPYDCEQVRPHVNGKKISCAPCYAQPVFHLVTNVLCFPESFAELGCNMLNEGIPNKVVAKFAREGELRSCEHVSQEVLSNGLSSFGLLTIMAVPESGDGGPIGWCPSKLRNIVQFMVLDPGSKIKTNFNNGTEGVISYSSCQQYPTNDECERNSAQFGDMKCKWCPVTNPEHKKRLGEGSCLPEPMVSSCSTTNADVFPRLMQFDESINIPDGPAQATCLFHSHDKKKCETGKHATFDKKREFECKHIEIPPVYNLVPSSLCIQKDIADLLLEQLEDVPAKVIEKFKSFESTTTSTETTTTTDDAGTTTATITFTNNNATTTTFTTNAATTTTFTIDAATTTTFTTDAATTTFTTDAATTTFTTDAATTTFTTDAATTTFTDDGATTTAQTTIGSTTAANTISKRTTADVDTLTTDEDIRRKSDTAAATTTTATEIVPSTDLKKICSSISITITTTKTDPTKTDPTTTTSKETKQATISAKSTANIAGLSGVSLNGNNANARIIHLIYFGIIILFFTVQ